MIARRLHPFVLICFVAGLAALFAMVEVQIEGSAGWAAKLPTWRVESHPLLDVFWGGRPLTGYHVWVFLFMALAFHFPLAFCGVWTVYLEARAIGCVMLFWVIEDFLWFKFNPAFGLQRLIEQKVPWHKHWLWGMPVDYWVFIVLGGVLVWFSFGKRAGTRN